MKKVIIGILVAVLLVIAGLGIALAVKTNQDKPKDDNNIVAEVSYLESKYAIGDSITFRVLITSDVELTKLTYVLNNGTEVQMTVKTGLSEDLEAKDRIGTGKYYIDTGIEFISTNDMTAGVYGFKLFSYDEDGTRFDFDTPRVIEIVNVQTAA